MKTMTHYEITTPQYNYVLHYLTAHAPTLATLICLSASVAIHRRSKPINKWWN